MADEERLDEAPRQAIAEDDTLALGESETVTLEDFQIPFGCTIDAAGDGLPVGQIRGEGLQGRPNNTEVFRSLYLLFQINDALDRQLLNMRPATVRVRYAR